MTGPNVMPVRMCIVIPLENGTFQPYCIACKWTVAPLATKERAENRARHHTCRRRGSKA